MDVVDEEDIHETIFVFKGLGGLVVDRLDELVGEFLGGDADDLGLLAGLPDSVAYGLHEVGLAQAYPSVDQAGVIGDAGVAGYGYGRVGGEGIVLPDDEILEGVVCPELGMLALGLGSLGGSLGFGASFLRGLGFPGLPVFLPFVAQGGVIGLGRGRGGAGFGHDEL